MFWGREWSYGEGLAEMRVYVVAIVRFGARYYVLVRMLFVLAEWLTAQDVWLFV